MRSYLAWEKKCEKRRRADGDRARNFMDSLHVHRIPPAPNEIASGRITPPLDPLWDKHMQLAWHVAVARIDTGADLYVEAIGFNRWALMCRPLPGIFTTPVGTFEQIREALHGFALGVRSERSRSEQS